MLRELLLLRHAEAQPALGGLRDIQRELTDSGFISAVRMGKYLQESNYKPGLFISSTARRASQTSELIAEQIMYNTELIVFEEQIYNQPLGGFINYIKKQDDAHSSIMLVGHNPTLSYFTEIVTNQTGFMLETCTAVLLRFELASWMLVDSAIAELVWQKQT